MSGIFLKSNGDQNDIKNVEFSRETKENDSGQKPGRNDPHAGKTGERDEQYFSGQAHSHARRVQERERSRELRFFLIFF
jgi:hypothetical protein